MGMNVIANIIKYYTSTTAGVYNAAAQANSSLRAPLIDAAIDMIYAQSCVRQARGAGTFLSLLINVNSPTSVYYQNLTFQLSQVNGVLAV